MLTIISSPSTDSTDGIAPRKTQSRYSEHHSLSLFPSVLGKHCCSRAKAASCQELYRSVKIKAKTLSSDITSQDAPVLKIKILDRKGYSELTNGCFQESWDKVIKTTCWGTVARGAKLHFPPYTASISILPYQTITYCLHRTPLREKWTEVALIRINY